MDQEQLAAWVRKSALASGVPEHVEGEAVHKVAALLKKGKGSWVSTPTRQPYHSKAS